MKQIKTAVGQWWYEINTGFHFIFVTKAGLREAASIWKFYRSTEVCIIIFGCFQKPKSWKRLGDQLCQSIMQTPRQPNISTTGCLRLCSDDLSWTNMEISESFDFKTGAAPNAIQCKIAMFCMVLLYQSKDTKYWYFITQIANKISTTTPSYRT